MKETDWHMTAPVAAILGSETTEGVRSLPRTVDLEAKLLAAEKHITILRAQRDEWPRRVAALPWGRWALELGVGNLDHIKCEVLSPCAADLPPDYAHNCPVCKAPCVCAEVPDNEPCAHHESVGCEFAIDGCTCGGTDGKHFNACPALYHLRASGDPLFIRDCGRDDCRTCQMTRRQATARIAHKPCDDPRCWCHAPGDANEK